MVEPGEFVTVKVPVACVLPKGTLLIYIAPCSYPDTRPRTGILPGPDKFPTHLCVQRLILPPI